MTKKPKKIEIEDIPTEADIARGNDALKRMLKTPPKQHKDMVGNTMPKPSKKTPSKGTAKPKKAGRLIDQLIPMPPPLGDLKWRLKSA